MVARIFVDPTRTSSRNGYTQDKVSIRVAVAKKKYSEAEKPRSVEVLTDSALLTRSQQDPQSHPPRRDDDEGATDEEGVEQVA